MPLSEDPDKRARSLANLRPWPPPKKGSLGRNRKDGLRSKRQIGVDAIRMEIYDQIAADAPVREHGELPPGDRIVVELLAREIARIREADAYLAKHGVLDENGVPRPALKLLERAGANAVELMRELALTPKSRAAIGVDLVRSIDLVKAMSEKDPERRAALMKEAGLD